MKKTNLWILMTVSIVLSVLAISLGCGAPAPKPSTAPAPAPATATAPVKMVLTATTFLPKGAQSTAGLDMLMDEIEKRTNGNITFKRNYGGSLLGPMDTLPGIGKGVADFGQIAPAYHPTLLPLHGLNYAFAFGPADVRVAAAMERAMYDKFPAFQNDMAKQNVRDLMVEGVGDYGIMSRQQFNTIADMKGKKVAVLGGFFASWVEPIGAIPVSSPATARYEQLKGGVVDGSLLPPSLSNDGKEYEVGQYYLKLHIGAHCARNNVVNLDVWKKLSPEYQKIFTEAGLAVEKQYAMDTEAAQKVALDLMKTKGIGVSDLSQQDIAQWASVIPDTPADFAKKYETNYPEVWDVVKFYVDAGKAAGVSWPRQYGIKK